MQNFTAKNVEKFFETNFLVPKKNLKTKYSNYKELAAYIDERANNYRDSQVSRERISHLTFVLKGQSKRSLAQFALKITRKAKKFAGSRAIISAAENAQNKCSKFQTMVQMRFFSVRSAVMIVHNLLLEKQN